MPEEKQKKTTDISMADDVLKLEYRNSFAYVFGCSDTFDNELKLLIDRLDSVVDSPDILAQSITTLHGHFGVVIVTKDGRHIYLISDPFGTIPLYYTKGDDGWKFGFRIRDILEFIERPRINDRGLDEMLLYRWLVEDNTLLHGVSRVLPSSCICLSNTADQPAMYRYAKIDFQPSEIRVSEQEVIEQTNKALDAYLSRLRHQHRKIGIFFSGGVDSSLLLAKAREHAFERVIACTAYFPGYPNPEAERAKSVASYFGADLRTVEVSNEFVGRGLPKLVWEFESPVSYANNFARAAMMKSIATEVDFVLTGEGADSMFSQEVGRAEDAARFQNKQKYVAWMPIAVRQMIGQALSIPHLDILDRLSRLLRVDMSEFLRSQGVFFMPGHGGNALKAEDLVSPLGGIRSRRGIPFYRFFEPTDPTSTTTFCENRGLYTQNRHQYYCYWAISRYYNLQVGLPFLSRDVSAIGLSLPDHLKSDPRGPKPILKKLLCKYLPEELVYAPKLGFEAPFVDWLKGPLAGWLRILSDERTKARGLYRQDIVSRLELSKDSHLIWIAITLEIFLRQFVDGDGPDVALN